MANASQDCKGRIYFEGSNIFTTYSRKSLTASNKDDIAENKALASKVCDDLFSGPRPAIGWWIECAEENPKERHWRPRAIISITGGAVDHTNSLKGVEKIIKTLVKTAKEMKAMIVDGGSSVGVMKEIGKAVEQDGNHVPLLGIFPWRAIFEDGQRAIGNEKVYRYSRGPCTDHRADLDRNHQYFALIEKQKDETIAFAEHNQDSKLRGDETKFWGDEIMSRYYIEEHLSSQKSILKKADALFPGCEWGPHVLIVVNGGLRTIDTAHTFSNGPSKRVPIVVIKNSGRAANVIARFWDNRKNQDGTEFFQNDGEKIKFVAGLFEEYSLKIEKSQHEEYAKKVISICQGDEAVTVFNIDDQHTLAYAIMKAICRGTRTLTESGTDNLAFDFQNQLKLLMQWNDQEGLELMRNELEEFKRTHKEESFSKVLGQPLAYALKQNLAGYVEHLLNFEAVITDATLKEVYGKSWEDFPHNLENGEPKQQARKLVNSLLYFQDLTIACAKQRHPTSIMNRMWTSFARIRCFEKLASAFSGSNTIAPQRQTPAGEKKLPSGERPSYRDMFLWSVISSRADLAWYFWFKSDRSGKQHCITRVLLACAIERACGRLPIGQQKLLAWPERNPRVSNDEVGSRFEIAATRILDLCYRKNPELAVSLITIPWIHPGDWFFVKDCTGDQLLSPLLLAFDARAKTFIDHPAYQACLDRIWYGRIKSDRVWLSRPDDDTRTRPEGFRIEHIGLFGWIQWCRPLRALLMELNVLGLIMEFNILVSCCTFIPILWSTIDCGNSSIKKTDAYRGTLLKLVGFYFSPCALFYLDFASYLTFLIIYTVVGFQLDYSYTNLEGFMHFWIGGFFIRELGEMMKGARYLIFGNNYFDVIMLTFYLPALALRIHERVVFSEREFLQLGSLSTNISFNNTTVTMTTLLDGSRAKYSQVAGEWGMARSWHGIAGIFFWVRIVDYFRAERTLGPLMLVLYKITAKSLQFLMVLFVFIISFGAAIICAARPRQDPSVTISAYFTSAIFVPLFEIFGEHFLEYNLSFSDFLICLDKDPKSECSENQSLGIVLLIIYLFISSIILMNLLIAMMNSSYNEVLQDSTSTWRFQRLELVLEFSRKSIVPLNILVLFFNILVFFFLLLLDICSKLHDYYIHLRCTMKSNRDEIGENGVNPCSSYSSNNGGGNSEHQCSRSRSSEDTGNSVFGSFFKFFALLYKILNESAKNSDLTRILDAFPEEQKDKPENNKSGYNDMYRNDKKMAALFQDIHGERFWMSSFDLTQSQDDKLVLKKADFVRDCADLVMAMCTKLVDSQKEEDARDAEQRTQVGFGGHLDSMELEIRGLKDQVASVKEILMKAKTTGSGIAEKEGGEEKQQQQQESAKTVLQPLPRNFGSKKEEVLGGQS